MLHSKTAELKEPVITDKAAQVALHRTYQAVHLERGSRVLTQIAVTLVVDILRVKTWSDISA